jgi:hypothetical protein
MLVFGSVSEVNMVGGFNGAIGDERTVGAGSFRLLDHLFADQPFRALAGGFPVNTKRDGRGHVGSGV